MSKEALIGIDLGTTVLKGAAFDAKTGKRIAESSQHLKVRVENDGTREQRPLDIDRGLKRLVSEIRDQAGADALKVQGIGLAAQGGSTLIANRETGEPYTAMALWNDARGRAYLPSIAESKTTRYWRSLSWNDFPGHGLGRIRFLQEHNPDLFTESNIYVGAGEYTYFKLTGVWRQDAGNALQLGCYRVATKSLDGGPLEIVNVPLSFVAPMREGHETHPLSEEGAKLTGLPAGIPVAGPYMDHEAGFLSATGISENPLQCSLGTAWVGNLVLAEEAHWSSPSQLVLPSPLGPSGWLVVQPLLAGNLTWEWGLETLLDKSAKRALSKAVDLFKERLVPGGGLVCLPWFTQSNTIESSRYGAGAFVGLSSQSSREEMIRAVVCGMVYEMARVFQEAKDSRLVDSLVLGGGASKGEFFQKLLSALFDPLPVLVVTEVDIAGPRGTVYAFDPAVSRCQAKRVKSPGEKTRKAILDGFQVYLKAFEKLYGHLGKAGVFTPREADESPDSFCE